MLTCQQLTELVTDYLEGQLPFRKRLSFHLHIGMCRDCRTYVRQMKLAVRTTGALPPGDIPDEVRDQLLRRFRDWKD
ncbi:MAG: zf-HC2 domain-containing protein [Deltaproteobacteria bacterium]|nr:zf-HC2 domain-containing protein [Deltaproteobacteria bacterium]